MQNQMMPKINLLKMPDPAARTQKYVNMMNATKQQEAAEQTLKLQQERAAREEALQEPALATAKSEADIKKLDFMMQFYKNTANDIANSSTPDEVVARAERLKQQFPVPELQARIDETVNSLVSDPSRFEENRKRILTRTLDAKDQFAVNHSDIFDMDGNLYTKRTSPIGAFPTEITPGVVTGPPVTGAASRAGAPAETPRTPVAPPAGPVPVGKYGEARVIPDNARPLTPDQQDHIRRLQEELGMTDTPASFTRGGMTTPTAGQMSPDMVPAIIDSAMKTGVMAQIDLDQMLAMTPPQARQGIVDVLRSNNVSLQADAPSLAASAMPQQQPMAPNPVGRQQSQFAVMRGQAPQASLADLGGQPEMQNTMAQYQVGQQIRGRNPSLSPTPGIYGVPTGQVAATSQAQRASKEEVFDTELAKIRAQRAAGPEPVTQQQRLARQTQLADAFSRTQTLLDKAYNPKEGVISLANKIKSLSDDQKEAITGLSGYVPSFRGSTKEADTLIGNLKGVVTALGKDVAAASGAIGPMAVQEWKIVADTIADLKLEGMTPRALDAQMNRVIEQVRSATSLAERVYDAQYGEDVKQLPAFKLRGAPPARTKTQVTKAPPGVSAAEWKAMTPAERKLWQ
jgi:hypothetical protein